MILHRIDLYLFDDWSGLVRDCVKGLGEIVTLCQVVCLRTFSYKHIQN